MNTLTSIEFGSQSRSWINIKYQNKNKTKKPHKQIKKKQTKRQKQKQSKNNYTHSDFSGYSKCGKKLL